MSVFSEKQKKRQYDKLSGLDNLFLLLEEDEHPMSIANCWIFDEEIERRTVIRELSRLVTSFPRFKQRVFVEPTGHSHWEDDPRFHLDNHLHTIPLYSENEEESEKEATGGDKRREKERRGALSKEDLAELEKIMGRLMSAPLDRTKPLWEAYIITGFSNGGCAYFSKMHHCIADGQGSVRMLLSITAGEGVDYKTLQYGAQPTTSTSTPSAEKKNENEKVWTR
jgi:diacylglycerol O-acyltransferase